MSWTNLQIKFHLWVCVCIALHYKVPPACKYVYGNDTPHGPQHWAALCSLQAALSMTPAAIRAAALSTLHWRRCSEQPERPDLHTFEPRAPQSLSLCQLPSSEDVFWFLFFLNSHYGFNCRDFKSAYFVSCKLLRQILVGQCDDSADGSEIKFWGKWIC